MLNWTHHFVIKQDDVSDFFGSLPEVNSNDLLDKYMNL